MKPTAPGPMFAVRCSLFAAPLASCTVGPDYKRPDTPVPASYRVPEIDPAARVSTATTDAADATRWWTSFNDPTLTSLVERAIAANLDVQAATARVRQARAARGVTAGALWPEVGANAAASRSRSSAGTGNLFRVGLDASWEIDIFGGTRRAVEAADASVQSALEDRRNVLVTLTSEVGLDYAQLRGLQEQLRVSRENLASQEASLDITRRKLAAGLDATRLDVANAEALVASTRSAIPTLETGIRQTIYELSLLLALEPLALEQELLAVTPIPQIPPTVPAGLPSDLLERRPDIRRAAAALHAATAQVGVATADLFPRFSLTGSLGFSSTQLSSLVNWGDRSWSVGPGVSWPLFTGGRIRSNIALSEARADEALIAYRQAVLTSLRDVQSALEAYAREQERRAWLAKAVDADRQAVQMSTRLYTEGQTDFLNVLSAQRSLLGAEEALAQSDRTLATNLIALYKALGGGWDPLAQ